MSPQSQAAGGVLPVPAAVLQRSTNIGNAPTGKTSTPRLKLILRRLAPGLTQAEFETALGDEWKLGVGKVDWYIYKPGKISKDLSKPSRPSRAYFHLTSHEHVQSLADKIVALPFHDAKNTFKDACLIGPPSLEYAPYPKVPLGKKRNDQRQGTIDQDADFQAFLQSLTDPITKPAPHESETEALPKQVTTTPLIEAIRARKAAKEQAAKLKAEKSRDSGKTGKEEKTADKGKAEKPVKGAKDASAEKGKKLSRADKAAKEAVKVLNTQATAVANKSKDAETAAPTAAASTPEKKRERGNASIAKQMLARDLGLAPSSSRRGRREAAPAAASESAAKPIEPPAGPQAATASAAAAVPPTPNAPAGSGSPEKSTSRRDNRPTRAERRAHKVSQAEQQPKSTPKPVIPPTILKKDPPTGPASQSTAPNPPTAPTPPTGPAATRAPPTGPRSPSVPAVVPPRPSTPGSSAPSTNRSAFLKHANPSQGITEELLKSALSAFGTVENVEIDKRKGFAYATFTAPEALRAAIKGSPVKVAEGAVVVLEKRDGGTGGRGQQGSVRGMSPNVRGGRGGRGQRGVRGGIASPIVTAAQPAASAAPTQTGNT